MTASRVNDDGLNFEYFQLFSDKRASEIFRTLEEEITYLEGDLSQVRIYGRCFQIPRKHVAFGDAGLSYTFSGVTIPAKTWTPLLMEIKTAVEQATGEQFNFVLINRYKDGSDKIGAHRDDERELMPNASICSLSLGQTRDFIFSRQGRASRTLSLKNGFLLVMKPPTNKLWTHCLPPRRDVKFPRINLTFRHLS